MSKQDIESICVGVGIATKNVQAMRNLVYSKNNNWTVVRVALGLRNQKYENYIFLFCAKMSGMA